MKNIKSQTSTRTEDATMRLNAIRQEEERLNLKLSELKATILSLESKEAETRSLAQSLDAALLEAKRLEEEALLEAQRLEAKLRGMARVLSIFKFILMKCHAEKMKLVGDCANDTFKRSDLSQLPMFTRIMDTMQPGLLNLVQDRYEEVEQFLNTKELTDQVVVVGREQKVTVMADALYGQDA